MYMQTLMHKFNNMSTTTTTINTSTINIFIYY